MDHASTAQGACEIEHLSHDGPTPVALENNAQATFFFSANTQFDNAGDALINRELLKVLRRHGVVRVARSGAPDAFVRQLRLEEGELRYKGRPELWLAASIEGLKARFFGARHPVLVLTPGDPGGPLDLDALVRGTLILALNLVGVRIVRLGVSINRMTRSRLLLEAFLSRFLYAVRYARYAFTDDRAKQWLPQCRLFSGLFACTPARREFKQRDTSVARVIVSLRNDNLDGDGKRALIAKVGQVIEALADGQRTVELHFLAQVGTDRHFMRELAARYGGPSTCMLTEEQDLDRLAEHYSSTDIIVSNRLHALLFASANGAVPFGLLTPEKNKKIIALLGDLDLARHWTSLDINEHVSDLSWLYARGEPVKAAFQRCGQLIEKRTKALIGASRR